MKLGERESLPATPVAKSAEPPRQASRAIAGALAWLVVLAVIGGVGYIGYDRIYLPRTMPVAAPPKRPIPVLTSTIRQGDMSLYLNGLGTVTAFNSVTVRSRVDGELVKVAFTEGQRVKQGDLLAEIDPRPFQVQLNQAEGPLTRDQAALEIAKQTLERLNQLSVSNAVSQQEIDTQTSLMKQAEGAIQTDRAQIANAKLQLDYCSITSPITGRIGLRLVDRGNMIRANDPNGLAIVTQLQPIAVIFTIPQDEIGRVRKRMLADSKLQVEAYNRDFSIKLASGTLAALDNQVDSTTGTVRLKAVFDNEDEMLFPNQFVNVRLLVDVREKAVIAPAAAIQRGPNFTFAYVFKNDSTVELRKLNLGPAEGAEVIVAEGLEPGERVVTDGLEKLQPGAAVALRDSKTSAVSGRTTAPPVATGTATADRARSPQSPSPAALPTATPTATKGDPARP